MNAISPLPVAARPYSIGKDEFREAMRHLAGAACVITAGIGEDRTGLTATSPTSLSADPPTLLVCVNRDASSLPIIASYRHFAVNVLAADQRHIAENFSGRGGLRGPLRYRGAEWSTLQTSASVLDGALASLDCELDEMIERHSHVILIGRVVASQTGGPSPALIYWRGDYDGLGAPARLPFAAGLAPY
jgi:flavin reductase (DIM6/NTAB) family NADH-FMN oxidoreductase RutF